MGLTLKDIRKVGRERLRTRPKFGSAQRLNLLGKASEEIYNEGSRIELLSNLVFEGRRSCGDLVGFGGFDSVVEGDACDDFGQIIKAA
ncbi:hypothetical protein LCGC14_0480150 [marine sediment metagenome]|uniref:Uncharacterized protein n=1 Tax=marine sediment metagenome TaxID=412755 RepID=A0A0F9VIC9_9ZZZZ